LRSSAKRLPLRPKRKNERAEEHAAENGNKKEDNRLLNHRATIPRPQNLSDMDPILIAYILIAVGVVLVLAEMVVPTGFILVAIGVCCVFVGIGLLFVHGSTETALMALLSLCVGGPILGGLVFYLCPYSPMGRKLIKAAEQDATIASMPANLELENLRGKIGRAVSPLRPSGIAEFDGRRIDVITEGMMVEAGQWVKCFEVRANRVVVRPADPPSLEEFENASFS